MDQACEHDFANLLMRIGKRWKDRKNEDDTYKLEAIPEVFVCRKCHLFDLRTADQKIHFPTDWKLLKDWYFVKEFDPDDWFYEWKDHINDEDWDAEEEYYNELEENDIYCPACNENEVLTFFFSHRPEKSIIITRDNNFKPVEKETVELEEIKSKKYCTNCQVIFEVNP